MVDPACHFSVVIPCFNEVDSILKTVDGLLADLAGEGVFEIIVVDDGSTDGSKEIVNSIVQSYDNVLLVEHSVNRGYGAALKSGIRRASSDLIAITDADGTYPNEKIGELVKLCEKYDMVVGARIGENVTYSKVRAIPKYFLRHWVSWIAGQNVPDINSGLRVFRKDIAESFFGVLSNKFSFTITITLSFLTTYRSVLYVPIGYKPRVGKSKIQPVRDTARFIGLILRTGLYFAPIRALAPIIALMLCLAFGSLGYDVFYAQNLTDKTVLLFFFAFNTGMFALLADMFDKRIGV
ncbi:MAG: glycosyltransferase family 2 protein [Halioglobus sp.]